ncbi:hypothetical protein HDF16_004774 [Granulicella aggregans]|uniref:Glycoside hydrolase family 5 domain-containing protein n=1 Tax=Granulicella aggregans TaxID=474949 RepID=A0A7W7ZHM6_9BACT|nr:cellulase family glycosylhydrolase [Granulicella aggregans]MBB5060038.1 hypothetical protein [Granulicella aggregans]
MLKFRNVTSLRPILAASIFLLALGVCGLGVSLASCSTSGAPSGAPSAPATQPAGIVSISGNRLLRDGALWVPHAVQLVAFVAPPSAQRPPFTAAYAHYSTAELAAIKGWGADSIRFQISQPGADPQNPRYDSAFVQTAVGAVKAARSLGLNVIVSIQDESQSGETSPTPLPNAATNRVWRNLAPMLNGDNGIIYEMFNEPQPAPNAANWQQWTFAMNVVVKTIRSTGATNTLLADGLRFAESLNGVVPLTDPLNQVFYSSHPYFHSAANQMQSTWAKKFGNLAATAPVIIGEWTTATTYYCDANTPTAGLQLLQYIQSLHIGLVAVTYDFGLPTYGGIVSDYNGTPTTLANGIACGATSFGPGMLIQSWYKTGAVPSKLQ